MPSSCARSHPGPAAAVLRLSLALLLLAGLAEAFLASAWAQAGGERWVTLATREIDVRAGRVNIDLTRAKGSFKAVRVSLRNGAVSLTQVDVRYHGGSVRQTRRAIVLRQGQRPRLVDQRAEEHFLDGLTLSFGAVAGEPERATLVVEGLQTASGAVAVRGAPGEPRGGFGAARKSAPEERSATKAPEPKAPETKAPETKAPEAKAPETKEPEMARRRGIAPRAAPPQPSVTEIAPPPPPVGGSGPPPVAAKPEAPAEPAPRAAERSAPPVATSPGPLRNGGAARSAAPVEPWDVVPVFYGTDRNRDTPDTKVAYGTERARRLELGRALVTVPKAHEVPNIERPWVYRLPFTQIVLYSEREDPKRHFTLKEVRALSREDFVRLVRERLGASRSYKDQALVFVHGFNTSFEHGLYRTAQIAYDIKFDGAPFLYSWPSKGALSSQDYSYDRESSGQAEPYLRQFLEMVARETGATSVSVIAHSMGNQLLLPVLRDLKHAAPPGLAISQVILAAPDVDRDAFENIAREVAGVSRGVTMLAAGNDRALDISRRFWGGVPRAGDVPAGGPVVVQGVDTIDVTAVSTVLFALNHSGYAETNALLSDIQQLLRTGERPPDKRVPILERVTTSKGDYWRYPTMTGTIRP